MSDFGFRVKPDAADQAVRARVLEEMPNEEGFRMSDVGFRVKPDAGADRAVTARVLEEMPNEEDFGCRMSDFG
jgi:hypothetical protein